MVPVVIAVADELVRPGKLSRARPDMLDKSRPRQPPDLASKSDTIASEFVDVGVNTGLSL